MELRSVDELMDLLHACRGVYRVVVSGGRPMDVHEHALLTAALLRRGRPADKELQVAGLIQGIGAVLGPAGDLGAAEPDARDTTGSGCGRSPRGGDALRAAEAVRALLGNRVAGLVRHTDPRFRAPANDDLLTLRQALQEAGAFANTAAGAGVLEDWRTVLELVSSRNSRLGLES